MKNRITWAKTFGLFSLLLFLLAFSYNRYENRKLGDVKVKIDYSKGNHFVSNQVINELLTNNLNDYPQIALHEINVSEMEKELNQYPFIKNAQVYITNNGHLFTDIIQEVPVVRVASNKESFYITHEGNKIPLSNHFSAKVFLLDGNIKKDEYTKISELANALNEDKLLKTLVAGIHKDKHNSFILLTADGEYSIEIGEIAHLKEKIENFNIFYNQYLSKNSESPYRKINLNYINQIIASK